MLITRTFRVWETYLEDYVMMIESIRINTEYFIY